MDLQALARLDTFPYRHRVAEVMATPVVTAAPDMPLDAAIRTMIARRVSSLLTVDGEGRPTGILTERDVLRAVAEVGAEALRRSVAHHASAPVRGVAAEAYVYVALARMDRHRIRHLAVTDAAGRAVGILSARTLLKLRAGQALAIGDRVAAAADARELRAAIAELPGLARALLDDGVGVLDIAALIAGAMRDATARAGELAAAAMAAAGRGAAPAAYALLVLGSGGRGESLLVPDQDNALIHDGGAGADDWFAELGRRIADTLDAAGIPYCKGKVMASEPAWRGSLAEWRQRIDRWVAQSSPADLLNVDIFYDFRAVAGDAGLADRLRAEALARAERALPFLKLLAMQLDGWRPPLGLFGGVRTRAGRADLKLGGLLPLVAGARLMALAAGAPATATAVRLRAAAKAGLLGDDDAKSYEDAYATILEAVLRQQLDDLAAGVAPSSRVAVGRLGRAARRRLTDVLQRVDWMRLSVRDALTAERRRDANG